MLVSSCAAELDPTSEEEAEDRAAVVEAVSESSIQGLKKEALDLGSELLSNEANWPLMEASVQAQGEAELTEGDGSPPLVNAIF